MNSNDESGNIRQSFEFMKRILRIKLTSIQFHGNQLRARLLSGRMDHTMAEMELFRLKLLIQNSEQTMIEIIQNIIANHSKQRILDLEEMIEGLIPCCSKSLKKNIE